MLYFDENHLDKEVIKKQIQEQLDIISYLYNLQVEKRAIYLQCLDKISSSIDNIKDVKNTDILFSVLNKVKNTFSILNKDIEALSNLKISLKSLNENLFSKYYINNSILIDLKHYNEDFNSFKNNFFETSIEIERFLKEYIGNCSFEFADSISVNDEAKIQPEVKAEPIPLEPVSDQVSTQVSESVEKDFSDSIQLKEMSIANNQEIFNELPNKQENIEQSESLNIKSEANLPYPDFSSKELQPFSDMKPLKTTKISDISEEVEFNLEEFSSKFEIHDNRVLLISEKEQKVYLPYYIDDLKKQLQKKHKKYSNIQDLIDNEYIIPLSRFKYPVLSRFKEAFSLMKYKEKASITECLDLAFELSFNNSLNPAIIPACKNLDELDMYLDCLDANTLDKFNLFEIKFDITPLEKK